MINQINILSIVKAGDRTELNIKTLARNSPVEKKRVIIRREFQVYTWVILPTECFPHEGFNYSQQVDKPDIISKSGKFVGVCVCSLQYRWGVCVCASCREGTTSVSSQKCCRDGGEVCRLHRRILPLYHIFQSSSINFLSFKYHIRTYNSFSIFKKISYQSHLTHDYGFNERWSE